MGLVEQPPGPLMKWPPTDAPLMKVSKLPVTPENVNVRVSDWPSPGMKLWSLVTPYAAAPGRSDRSNGGGALQLVGPLTE